MLCAFLAWIFIHFAKQTPRVRLLYVKGGFRVPTIEELWAYLQDKFRASLTATGYSTWIKDAKPVRLTGNTLTIGVPSELHKNYWEKRLVTKVVEWAFAYNNLEINPVIEITGSLPDELIGLGST